MLLNREKVAGEKAVASKNCICHLFLSWEDTPFSPMRCGAYEKENGASPIEAYFRQDILCRTEAAYSIIKPLHLRTAHSSFRRGKNTTTAPIRSASSKGNKNCHKIPARYQQVARFLFTSFIRNSVSWKRYFYFTSE